MHHETRKCLGIITGSFHIDGGIAAVNRLVMKTFLEKGFSVDVLALLENNSEIDDRYLCPGAHMNYRAFSGRKFFFTLAVWRKVLSKHYDYIFVDHVNLASILALFSWLKLCKYIVWMHGAEVFQPLPDFEGRLGLLNASKRLASSEITKKNIIRRFPNMPVEVCDLALDPVRHTHVSTPGQSTDVENPIFLLSLNGGQSTLGVKTILHVGRMLSGERYKGQDSLIEALPLIYQHDPEVQLVLVGQGDDMPRLKSLAQNLPADIRSRVFFPGYVPDDLLNQLYQACYVFAMPSIGEGFGLVNLEAMSRGKPCLGGKVDATPCVVRDGETGILVDDPRSPEQVARALIWFLDHPAETVEMGRKGIELVQSYYLFQHFEQRFWRAVLQE